MIVKERWSLVEYDSPKEILSEITNLTGFTLQQVRELIIKSGERAGQSIGHNTNPLSISANKIRAKDIAGIFRVAPNIEIEVAPKFLGLDSDNENWREDFFFLATLSKHGRLLETDHLKSRSGERSDLHTLVARSMVNMYWINKRRPLRTYNIKQSSEFAFDGEVDPEDILLPSPDGFIQTSIVFDKQNPYNATILAAARSILPNLRDPSTIAQLQRMIDSLSPQKNIVQKSVTFNFPNRSKRWQTLYDLSVDVLNGFGLTLKAGKAIAPGYVLDTWRVWEDFLGIALRLGFGSEYVKTQVSSKLGIRQRFSKGKIEGSHNANVRPDVTVFTTSDRDISFLIDAKYKGNVLYGKNRIAESDLYEALAFSRATNCKTVILCYPSMASSRLELGEVVQFEKIIVDDIKIFGVEIESKGISKKLGLSIFSKRCSEQLNRIAQ